MNQKDNEVIKMEIHDDIYLSVITIKFKNYLVSFLFNNKGHLSIKVLCQSKVKYLLRYIVC